MIFFIITLINQNQLTLGNVCVGESLKTETSHHTQVLHLMETGGDGSEGDISELQNITIFPVYRIRMYSFPSLDELVVELCGCPQYSLYIHSYSSFLACINL